MGLFNSHGSAVLFLELGNRILEGRELPGVDVVVLDVFGQLHQEVELGGIIPFETS